MHTNQTIVYVMNKKHQVIFDYNKGKTGVDKLDNIENRNRLVV